MSDLHITICVPAIDRAQEATEKSVAKLLEYFRSKRIHGRLVMLDADPKERARAYGIWHARQGPSTHLLMIDRDIAFEPEAVQTLLDMDTDVTCAAYVSRAPPHDRFIIALDSPNKFQVYKVHGHRVISTAWTGNGFMLVKRSFLDHMCDVCKELEYVEGDGNVLHALFQTFVIERRYFGEDIAFCRRVQFCGGEILCAVDVELWHDGHGGRLGDIFIDRSREEIDHPRPA